MTFRDITLIAVTELASYVTRHQTLKVMSTMQLNWISLIYLKFAINLAKNYRSISGHQEQEVQGEIP